MEIKGLSYSAISLSMYVVLKSTYVDHSDYVPGFYIHVRRHEESYIAEEEKQHENRSIPPDPQKNSYAPLQLGLIQRGTRTYSSTKPSLHKGDRRREPKGKKSPHTRRHDTRRDFDEITDAPHASHSPSMGTFAYLCG